MRTIRWVAGCATAAAIGLSVWFTAGWGDEALLRIACNVGCLVLAVFATVSAGWAARRSRGRHRVAWIWLTVAAGGWAIGTALWAYYEFGLGEPPFPSPADAGYLLFPVAAAIGLALLAGGRSGRSRTRLLLDGIIAASALFQISWVTVLHATYAAGDGSRFAVGLAMAYPVGDLVVITVAVLVLARARSGQRLTLTLLTLGAIAMALSDSAFVYLTAHREYRGGTIADVGWVLGLLLIGLAALSTARTPTTEPSAGAALSKAALWLPYLPIIAAAVVCAPAYIPLPGLIPLLFSAVCLIAAVLGRQFLVVRENRQLLEVVADQALRDPLTGLANRALFQDRLTHAMQLHQRDKQSVAVLSLDLDDFKLVNDNLGHPAGDALLELTAERILVEVRTGDTVARLGGDEFAVLLEGNAEDSRLVALRVAQSFERPFMIDGHELLLRTSVGLAVASPGDADTSGDVLLKQADVAMYSAKRSRTGDVHTFTPDMQLGTPPQPPRVREPRGVGHGPGAVQLLGQLRQAIDQLDLTLLYQPKLELRDGEIIGVEALVRWPHPEHGLLGPDRFLPIVREHGLMRSVTELVLARALDDAAAWQADGVRVPVAVNVFAPSLCDLTLPDRILSALADRGLSPDVLTIEITEDLLLDDIDRTRIVLDSMRAHGIRVAIDDFGSGYSALSYLCELSIDELKLDRRFIAPILHDPRAAAVVRSVIDLAHELGVTTVAEGVENAATAVRLREYGCEAAQGFHYSRPIDADALLELVRAANSTAPVAARSS